MKMKLLVSALAGILVSQAEAQVASTQFAPINFGDTIFTATPSNATGSSGISSVFGSNGSTATFGTGGALVNPSAFTYTVTGPNTATLVMPASGSTPQATTELTFTSPLAGTYATTTNGSTSTGSFKLADIPASAPIANVSVRTNLSAGETATVGFIVAGTMPRRVLIRAIGPGLTTFGVTGVLGNPTFTLFRGGTAIARNDDWGTAASLPTSTSGSTGTSIGTGTGGTGSTGTTGPTGTATGTGTSSGTSGITVLPASDNALATSQIFAQVGAFGLTNGSRDSASVVTLQPGAYTIQISASTSITTGTTGTTGTTTTGTTGTGTTATGTTGTGTTGTGTTGTTGTGTTGTGTTGTGTIGTGTTGTGATGTTGTSGTSPTTTVTSNSGEVLLEVYFVE